MMLNMDTTLAVICVAVYLTLVQVTCIEPTLLWTQKSHAWSKIRGVIGNPDTWIRQKHKPYVQTESQKYTFNFALTYNPTSNYLIWSDISKHNIVKQDINSSLTKRTDDIQEILKTDDIEVSALTVDWLAGSVYFIERTQRLIAVQSERRVNNLYKVLLKSTVQDPTSLAIDPYRGLLFWSDKSKRTIESCTTTGSQQSVLISNLQKPSGITVDIAEQRIYYLDEHSSTINSIKYDGSDNRQLYRAPHKRSYFEITSLTGYLFITTGDGLQIDVHRKTGEHLNSTDVDASIFHIIGLQNYPKQPHECENKGCEQICLNVDGSKGQCTCATGYALQPDGISCQESQEPAYVFIKDKSVIVSEALLETSQVSLSHNVIKQDTHQARAVGVHFENSFVFYSDIWTDMIYRGDTKGTEWKEITAGTRQVEGITIDWVTNTVFWSDKVLQYIMCSQLTGHYHRIHVDNTVQPKDLTIDQVNKRLVWTSNHNGVPRIEAVGLDGMGRRTILDQGSSGEFTGIVMDPVTNRIYFSNRGQGIVESVGLNGQQRLTIMATQQVDLYGVAMHQNYLTYTSESSQTPKFWDAVNNRDIKVVNSWTPASAQHNNMGGFYDVALLDASVQPPLQSSCQQQNGGCSQLCFQKVTQSVCDCAIGYQLGDDGRSCNSDISADFFILFVDPYHKQIYQMQTNSREFRTQGVPVSRMEFPVSIDFDLAGRRVYWIDRETKQIKSSRLDGSQDQVFHQVPQGSRARSLAIDPIGRTVYYIDGMQKSIKAINIDSKTLTVFEHNLSDPMAIAVDHDNRMLYWTDGGRLERRRVDGDSSKEGVLVSSNIQLKGLTYTSGMVYTGVWENGDIYYIDTNTSSLDLSLQKLTTVGSELYSLAADSNYLYFTKWNEKGVYRVDRSDGSNEMLLGRSIFARLTDIKAVESLLPQPAMVVPPPGDNTVVIIAAAVGALVFLLLLALLFGLLAARKCRSSKTPENGTSADNSEGFENGDRDAEFMMYANGTVFDLRGSSNRSLSTDSGVSALSSPSTTELINPDVTSNVAVENGGFEGGESQTGGVGGGVPVLPTGAAPPPLSKRFTKKAKSSHKRIKPEAGDPNDFNLREDKKVATVIQRLATRLRKRLSSIRYDDPESKRPGINTNDPSDVNIEVDGVVDPGRLYPEKNKMPPNKRMIYIPSKLHKEPRGWAPASHNVPRTVINTLGRAKGQVVNASVNDEEL